MAFEALQQTTNSGFEGALSGMTLADLIQIKNINRFYRLSDRRKRRQERHYFFQGR